MIAVLSILLTYLFISVLLTTFYAAYSLAKDNSILSKYFAILCSTIAVYVFGYMMELSSNTIDYVLFWNKIEYFGLPFIPALWLMFSLYYFNREYKIKFFYKALVFIIPVIIFILHFTGDFHDLYYKNTELITNGYFYVLKIEKGVWYIVNAIYTTLCLIITTCLYFIKYKKTQNRRRVGVALMITASLLPWMGVILNIILNYIGLDFTAFFFPLSCLLLLISIMKYEFLNMKPLIREKIFKNTNDGIIVLDCGYKVIDYNSSAVKIFSELKNNQGKHIDKILIKHGNEITKIEEGINVQIEITGTKRTNYYKISVSNIYDKNHFLAGYIITLTDITKNLEVMKALRESEHKFKMLITQMHQGLALCQIIYDKKGNAVNYRFLEVNSSYEKLTRLKKDNITGKTAIEVFSCKKDIRIEKYCNVALTGGVLLYERYDKELDRYFEEVVYSPQYNQFAVIISDITKRKKMEKSLLEEKELFKTTLISVGDGVISTDKYGKIELINKAGVLLTGWILEDAKGKSSQEVFYIYNQLTKMECDDPVKKVLRTGKTVVSYDDNVVLASKDGTNRSIEYSVSPIKDSGGNINGAVITFRDFTDKKDKQKKIEYLSYHDQLTGIYNRRFFEEELKRLDVPRNLPITLIMADVNGLKLANDAFGHNAGDKLLKKVAKIMKRECRADDILARIGGDEFILLLPRTDVNAAKIIVSRIKQASSNEEVDSIILSISFGWAVKSDSSENIDSILKEAEDYMYRKKLTESFSMRNETINIIIKTLYEKNQREEKHSKRVSSLCEALGNALGLNEGEVSELRTAGLMHDIGKIAIDKKILDKKGKLSSTELVEIKRHPEIGYRILSSVNEFAQIAEYILAHHERWDGSGYPKGLKKDEIPFGARIIAIADAYDAMTSERPYRDIASKDEAVEEIKRSSGAQFDPEIATVFIEKVLNNMHE